MNSRIQPLSAIIVSYNDRVWMRHCIHALYGQLNVPGDEIIVVDNASTDGVLEDLRRDARVKLIENAENAGFPVGCNIGYGAAAPGNDIFLLNNDAVPAEGSVDHLRKALAYLPETGAVGAVSNNALEQIEKGCPPGAAKKADGLSPSVSEIEEAMRAALAFGAQNNRVIREPYEYRSRLTGFAVLIKREAADRLFREDGFFMDPRFSPGYFEDEDLGVRLSQKGYRQVLCHNAFIWHKGGDGFASHPEALARARSVFEEKWGFDAWAVIGILEDYEQAVQSLLESRRIPRNEQQDAAFSVLETDCAMGVNLAHLKYLYPNCRVLGIEGEPLFAQAASTLIDVIGEDTDTALTRAQEAGSPEAAYLVPGSFDLIFVWDLFERCEKPQLMKNHLKRLLKPGGRLII